MVTVNLEFLSPESDEAKSISEVDLEKDEILILKIVAMGRLLLEQPRRCQAPNRRQGRRHRGLQEGAGA